MAGIDYGTGIRITHARARGERGRAWLLVSMISNLGLLGYFKYANFGIASFNTLLGAAGGEPIAWTEVILPVGISFYTFQTMSYTIDIYWDRVNKADSFIDYLCYVTMFPQLVAGPIVRYITVEEQLRKRTHTAEKFFQGIVAMQTGLVKKLLLADTIAQVADSSFAAPDLTPLAAWAGGEAAQHRDRGEQRQLAPYRGGRSLHFRVRQGAADSRPRRGQRPGHDLAGLSRGDPNDRPLNCRTQTPARVVGKAASRFRPELHSPQAGTALRCAHAAERAPLGLVVLLRDAPAVHGARSRG